MTVAAGCPEGAGTQTGIWLLLSSFPEKCAINLAIWRCYLNKMNSLPSGDHFTSPQNVYKEKNSIQQATSPLGGEPHTHVCLAPQLPRYLGWRTSQDAWATPKEDLGIFLILMPLYQIDRSKHRLGLKVNRCPEIKILTDVCRQNALYYQ